MHKEEANRSQLPSQRRSDVFGATTGQVAVHVETGTGCALAALCDLLCGQASPSGPLLKKPYPLLDQLQLFAHCGTKVLLLHLAHFKIKNRKLEA